MKLERRLGRGHELFTKNKKVSRIIKSRCGLRPVSACTNQCRLPVSYGYYMLAVTGEADGHAC